MKGTCQTCGRSAAFHNAEECTNCWEVERRLDEYLRSPGGRKFVAEALLRTPSVFNVTLVGDPLLERMIVDLKHLREQEKLDPEDPRVRSISDALCALAAALGRLAA